MIVFYLSRDEKNTARGMYIRDYKESNTGTDRGTSEATSLVYLNRICLLYRHCAICRLINKMQYYFDNQFEY